MVGWGLLGHCFTSLLGLCRGLGSWRMTVDYSKTNEVMTPTVVVPDTVSTGTNQHNPWHLVCLHQAKKCFLFYLLQKHHQKLFSSYSPEIHFDCHSSGLHQHSSYLSLFGPQGLWTVSQIHYSVSSTSKSCIPTHTWCHPAFYFLPT